MPRSKCVVTEEQKHALEAYASAHPEWSRKDVPNDIASHPAFVDDSNSQLSKKQIAARIRKYLENNPARTVMSGGAHVPGGSSTAAAVSHLARGKATVSLAGTLAPPAAASFPPTPVSPLDDVTPDDTETVTVRHAPDLSSLRAEVGPDGMLLWLSNDGFYVGGPAICGKWRFTEDPDPHYVIIEHDFTPADEYPPGLWEAFYSVFGKDKTCGTQKVTYRIQVLDERTVKRGMGKKSSIWGQMTPLDKSTYFVYKWELDLSTGVVPDTMDFGAAARRLSVGDHQSPTKRARGTTPFGSPSDRRS